MELSDVLLKLNPGETNIIACFGALTVSLAHFFITIFPCNRGRSLRVLDLSCTWNSASYHFFHAGESPLIPQHLLVESSYENQRAGCKERKQVEMNFTWFVHHVLQFNQSNRKALLNSHHAILNDTILYGP